MRRALRADPQDRAARFPTSSGYFMPARCSPSYLSCPVLISAAASVARDLTFILVLFFVSTITILLWISDHISQALNVHVIRVLRSTQRAISSSHALAVQQNTILL